MISLNYGLHPAVSVPHISRWQRLTHSDLRGVTRCQPAASARIQRALTCSAATLSPQQVQKRSRDDDKADEKGLSDYKVLCYSAQKYVHDTMEETIVAAFPKASFIEATLDRDTVALSKGYDAVILFVNDDCSAEVAEALKDNGVEFVAMRCAGFDKVDVKKLNELSIKVARVPTYSPESVAEHSVTLALALNRNIVKAHNRVMQGNYTLSGLIGVEICRKTVGVVGTGAIGACAARIWKGFGCRVIAFDVKPNKELADNGTVEYLDMDEVLQSSDILTLHCPLMSKTFHIIDKDGIEKMKQDAILINCSRGGLVDTAALVDALESGKISGAAMDVYEKEGPLFFQDFSQYTHKDRQKMNGFDRQWQLLLSFPNFIATPHIAFLTQEALVNIAETTVDNLKQAALGKKLSNEVEPQD